MIHRCLFVLSLVLPSLAGCSSIGPATVGRDRLDYAAALAEGSKRETLLNIVKLRYADAVSLITISQLVAGYTLEGRVNLNSDFFRSAFELSDDVGLGVGGTFSDRPTATYTPIRGDDLARLMLTPIPPSELFAMLATRAPAALILGLGVESINGLRNWAADAQGVTRVETGFVEVLQLLEELRGDGILGFGFQAGDQRRTAYLLLEEPGDRQPDARAARLLELLGLDRALTRFPIHFGFGSGGPDEIRMYTRSLLEILSNLAAQVEVPEGEHRRGADVSDREKPGPAVALAESVRPSPPRPRAPQSLCRRRIPRHLVLDRRSRLPRQARLQCPAAAAEPGRQERCAATPGDHHPERIARSD